MLRLIFFEALDLQEKLQTMYTGGTVFHGFIGESIEDPITCRNLVRSIASNYRIPYFTLTPTYSICPSHGYLRGEVVECPTCHSPTEVYSRVVGYYRPIRNWNPGKQSEFALRKTFNI